MIWLMKKIIELWLEKFQTKIRDKNNKFPTLEFQHGNHFFDGEFKAWNGKKKEAKSVE